MTKVPTKEDLFRRRTLQREIPGLGTVTLASPTVGAILIAEEQSSQASEEVRINQYVNTVLDSMVTSPSVGFAKVASLPDESLAPLLQFAAEICEIADEYERLDSNVVAQERFYRAHRQWLKKWKDSIDAKVRQTLEHLSIGMEPLDALEEFREKLATINKQLISQVASFDLGPVIFEELKSSGWNSPAIHSPTYVFPVVDLSDDEIFSQKEESQRALLVDSYDILMHLERSLRALVCSRLRKVHGEKWWKRGVPEGVRSSCEKLQRDKDGDKLTRYHPINYCYFNDYKDIIVKKDNWRDAFSVVFTNKTQLEACFAWAIAARDPVAHARTITEQEYSELVFAARWLNDRIDQHLSEEDTGYLH